MSTLTHPELSFLRLLERTKRLAREDLRLNIWKVTAAVLFLDNLISRMQDEKGIHAKETLLQYRREVNQLQLLADAEKKASAEEKLDAVEKIPRLFPDIHVTVNTGETNEKGPLKGQKEENGAETATGVRHRNRAVYRADIRRQLLGPNTKEDEDDKFRRQEFLETELANELLSMTRSLKSTMSAANAVIKDDNKRLKKIQTQVDSNKDALEVQGKRVAHHAYKCGFDCMLIFVALFIFWSFISMVVLMKVFPKRVNA